MVIVIKTKEVSMKIKYKDCGKAGFLEIQKDL